MNKERILALLEKGTITADEAIRLLEALGENEKRQSDLKSEDIEADSSTKNATNDAEQPQEGKKKSGSEIAFDVAQNVVKTTINVVEDLAKNVSKSFNDMMQKQETKKQEETTSPEEELEDQADIPSETKEDIKVKVNWISVEISQHADPSEREIVYRFIDEESGEIIETPEGFQIFSDDRRLRINESFAANIGPKMMSNKAINSIFESMGITYIDKPHCKLVIEIPQGDQFKRVHVETKSGSLLAQDLSNVNHLVLSTLSGQVRAERITADKITASSVSGMATLKQVLANKMNISTVSGKIKFFGRTPVISASSVSGSVYIVNEHLLYNSSISTVSGAIRCFIKDEHRQNYRSSSAMKRGRLSGRTNGEPGTSLNFSVVSGSINLADIDTLASSDPS